MYKEDCDIPTSPEHPRPVFAYWESFTNPKGVLIGSNNGEINFLEGEITHVEVSKDRQVLPYWVTTPKKEALRFQWQKVADQTIRLMEEENEATHIVYIAKWLLPYKGIAPILT